MLTAEDLDAIRVHRCPGCDRPVADADQARAARLKRAHQYLLAMLRRVAPDALANTEYRRELAGRAVRLADELEAEADA